MDTNKSNDAELAIEAKAIEFARANKKTIAKRLTNTTSFRPEGEPVSVFMAGSPGAGKTEASVALIESFKERIIRIDPDELRAEFSDYTGDNAWLFQKAVSILVEKLQDMALSQEQSFVLDGTLSRFEIAEKNVKRSLGRKRTVQLLYVYQEPMLAWKFVQTREAAEGRRIRPEHFVAQYFGARAVVNRLKKQFGTTIKVDLLMKNNDNSSRFYRAGVETIESHIPECVTQEELERQFGLK